MDDKRTQVEFPVGKSGHTVIVEEPTEGQMLALMLSRAPGAGDHKAQVKLLQRVFRILEAITGDQWDSVIEEGLISGNFTVSDVAGVIEQVVKFDWESVKSREAVEPETDPEPVQPDPSPRVISRA